MPCLKIESEPAILGAFNPHVSQAHLAASQDNGAGSEIDVTAILNSQHLQLFTSNTFKALQDELVPVSQVQSN